MTLPVNGCYIILDRSNVPYLPRISSQYSIWDTLYKNTNLCLLHMTQTKSLISFREATAETITRYWETTDIIWITAKNIIRGLNCCLAQMLLRVTYYFSFSRCVLEASHSLFIVLRPKGTSTV